MVVSGKVTRMVDFGAFVELEPGLEGLVHISELADKRVRTAGDVVKPGQEVQGARAGSGQGSPADLAVDPPRERDRPAPAADARATRRPGSRQKKQEGRREKKRSELKGGLDFDFWNKKL